MPKKERKGAKGARKVKTGCSTCKIRHKKCDETKPACSQCTSTGRKCDLLSSAETLPGPTRQLGRRLWSLASEPRGAASLHVMDTWHFEYFRTVCARDFSLYLGTGVWETVILRAALEESCIMHGILALAALARNAVPGSVHGRRATSLGFPVNYSLKKYNQAIQELNMRLVASPDSWELAVLGGIVFVAVESLRGNREAAQMHLRGALAILGSHRVPSIGGSQIKADMTHVLDGLSRLGGQPLGLATHHTPVSPRFLDIPSAFTSISQARNSLNSITGAMNSLFWKGNLVNRPLPRLPLSPALAQDLSKLSSLLDSWETVFTRFVADHVTDVKTTTCIKILLIHHQVSRISALTYFYSSQVAYDVHLSGFSRIIDLAREILKAENISSATTMRSVSNHAFDIAIVQPLFFVACKCRDSHLRKSAIETMDKIRGGGHFDMKLLTQVARWVVTIEENTTSMMESPPVVVKEEDRLQDIELDLESTVGTCSVKAWKKRVTGEWVEVNAQLHIS